jgi:hypothetical protein
MSETEEWRAVPGFEGEYEVSSFGRVRSLDRIVSQASRKGLVYQKAIRGRMLRPGKTGPFGHVSVSLRRLNSKLVHALVAAAFIGPRPAGFDVAHLDGDGANNLADNLRYVSRSENNIHISKHDRRKLKIAQVRQIKSVARRDYATAQAVAAENGCCTSQVYNIWEGRQWKHLAS